MIVTLNGQVSSLTCINKGASQVSVLCALFFFIYINNPADGLSSNPKLSADDTSLFSVIHGFDTFANELNNDLHQINKWAFQWKWALTQTQNFSSFGSFNNSIVSETPYQKHLCIFLDVQLTFEEYLKEITTKVNKIIGLLQELQKFLPRLVLKAHSKVWEQW